MRSNKPAPLHHSADFDNAIYFALPVTVWQQGEMIGEGMIQQHSDAAVKIGDSYFLKATCEFKIK